MSYSQNLLRASVLALILLPLTACGGSHYSVQPGVNRNTATAGQVRKIPAISVDVHKRVQKLQEAIDSRDYGLASTLRDSLTSDERLNGYERAVVWQLAAMLAYEMDDTPGTITAYQHILENRDMIPFALELGILKTLSMLHYANGDLQEARAAADDWLTLNADRELGASGLQYLAKLNYDLKNYEATLTFLDRALAKANTMQSRQPTFALYELMVPAAWELGKQDKAIAALKSLVIEWPHADYCRMLAGAYEAQGMAKRDAISAVQPMADRCSSIEDTKAPTLVSTAGDQKFLFAANQFMEASRTDTSDYLPLVRVQPQYPRKAIEDKVTGYVVIELTVMENGWVDPASIKVLEAEPPGYFEATVRSAASKFKYKPKMVRGKPQTVTGVQYRFNFDLGENILNGN